VPSFHALLEAELRCCPTPSLPAEAHPFVQLVKVDRSGEHQKTSGDQLFVLPSRVGESRTRNDAGALGADIVTAMRDLAEAVDQGLQLGAVVR
jgi:hypothetical protein